MGGLFRQKHQFNIMGSNQLHLAVSSELLSGYSFSSGRSQGHPLVWKTCLAVFYICIRSVAPDLLFLLCLPLHLIHLSVHFEVRVSKSSLDLKWVVEMLPHSMFRKNRKQNLFYTVNDKCRSPYLQGKNEQKGRVFSSISLQCRGVYYRRVQPYNKKK